jgi:hypothetical protein
MTKALKSKSMDSNDAGQVPGVSKRDLVIDLLAFGVTLLSAILLKWKTKDIVWGLWACSLCVGYAYIVVGITASVYHARDTGRIVIAAGGLFLLAFFTFHFGMFHYVHSVFLNMFFPLLEGERAFPNIFATLSVALKSYWPIVLATFASRFSDFPFSGVEFGDKKNMFAKPYANVVRMHLLIFIFAGLHAAGVADLGIYPVLLFYFVPWGGLRREFQNRSSA